MIIDFATFDERLSSYGLYVLKALQEDHDVNVLTHKQITDMERLTSDQYINLFSCVKSPRKADVTIHNLLPPLINPNPNTKNIAILNWYTSRLPDSDVQINQGLPPEKNNWVKQLALMDEVWCVSKFTMDVASKYPELKSKLKLIGGCIDTDFWNPDKINSDDIPDGIIGITHSEKGEELEEKFVVCGIADFNEKSDLERLVTLTCLALPPAKAVLALVGKDLLNNGSLVDIIKHFKSRLTTPASLPVVVLEQNYNDAQLRGIISKASVFVSTSRGEGFNIHAAQAMSLGKHVILPGYSSNTELMKNNKCGDLYGGTVEVVRTMNKNPWLNNNQVWGSINELEYIKILQKNYEDFVKNGVKFNENGRKSIEERYGLTAFRTRANSLLS